MALFLLPKRCDIELNENHKILIEVVHDWTFKL